jgi:hypothetical protein
MISRGFFTVDRPTVKTVVDYHLQNLLKVVMRATTITPPPKIIAKTKLVR